MAGPDDYKKAYGRLADYNIVDNDDPIVAERMKAEDEARTKVEAAEQAKKDKATASRSKGKGKVESKPKSQATPTPPPNVESKSKTIPPKKDSADAPKTSNPTTAPSTASTSSPKPAASSSSNSTATKNRSQGYIVTELYPDTTSALEILQGPWDRIRYENFYRVAKEYTPAQIRDTFNANHEASEHVNYEVVSGRFYSTKQWAAKKRGVDGKVIDGELKGGRK